MDESEKEQQAQQQAMMQIQQLVESQKTLVKLTRRCFKQCVQKPGKTLGGYVFYLIIVRFEFSKFHYLCV